MGQDVDFLMDVLQSVMDKDDVKVRFIGSNVSAELSERIQAAGKDKFELLPFMPHQQALEQMAASNVLLLLINRYEGYQGMLTTKLFEYLGVGVPILALGPRGGEAEELIQTHQAGAAFDRDQADQAKEWLNQQYQLHKSGHPVEAAKDTGDLSSIRQSQILLNALSSLLPDSNKSES
jgi:glycosyltransferase involved in cell wall biosynthesis